MFRKLLTFGRRSEILGIDYIRSVGFRIVASAYRTKQGEVDIIAWDGEVLVFIEVKSRRSCSPPEDSVGFRKRQRVRRAAEAYITRYRLENKPYRFDILAITAVPGQPSEFRLHRGAFGMYN